MKNRRLWIILVGAIALRGGLLIAAAYNNGRVRTPDSQSYRELARSIRQEGQFVRKGQAEIFRTPGYPAYLALTEDVANGMWMALAGQIVLDLVLVVLAFVLGKMLAGTAAGLLAAGLQACSPLAIAASCRVLSDSLFALLLTLTVVLLVVHFRKGPRWSLIVAAAAMVAGCYVRPVGLAFAVVIVGVLLWRAGVLRALAFAAIMAACVAPWIVRNKLAADYSGFSSFAGDSAYRFSAAEIMARRSGEPVEEVRRRLDDEVLQQDLPTPGAQARYRRRRARAVVSKHRWAYVGVHLSGMWATLLPGATDVLEVAGLTTGQRGTLDVLHRRGVWAAARHYFGGQGVAIWLAAPMVLIWLGRGIGVAVCVMRRARLGMSASAWIVLVVVGVAVMAGGPAATPRFRTPIEPLLSVAAAAGMLILARAFRRRPSDESGD
ncbi:MAG: hypothetical protein ACYS8X_11805 [Planctomycetota bacterium]|jgi:4-amino-4-deoxy-L-arabinose transferase-like glycosyltransferase